MDVPAARRRLTIATADGRIARSSGGGVPISPRCGANIRRRSSTRVGTRRLDARRRRARRTLDVACRQQPEGRDHRPACSARQVAGETIPLRLARARTTPRPNEDSIEASYGRVLQAVALARSSGSDMTCRSRAARARPRRGAGRNARTPTAPGSGSAPTCRCSTSTTGSRLRDRDRTRRDGVGRRDDHVLRRLRPRRRRARIVRAPLSRHEGRPRASRGSEWKLDLRAREVAGTPQWSTPERRRARTDESLRGCRASRCRAPPSCRHGAARTSRRETKAASSIDRTRGRRSTSPPTRFVSQERDLGRARSDRASRTASDWRIEKLVARQRRRTDRRQGRVARYRQAAADAARRGAVDVKDAGAFLARFGYPDAMQGRTDDDLRVSSRGRARRREFDYPTLTGAFRLTAGRGRFTKIEPGIGKLLGVLSLQALPRRISLDFQDVFSEGFAFDEITGDVRVNNGVMITDDLRLIGPAAQGRHRRRHRPREGDATSVGARAAGAIDGRVGRRGAAVPRQPARRRRGGRRIAARAKRSQGPDRADSSAINTRSPEAGRIRWSRAAGPRRRASHPARKPME